MSIRQIIAPTIEFNQNDQTQFFVLILLIVGIFIYYGLSKSIKKYYSKVYTDTEYASFYGCLFQRGLGLLLFGVIPVTLMRLIYSLPLTKYGFNLKNIETSLLWTFILGPIIIIGNYYLAGKKENLKNYPPIRFKQWNSTKHFINSSTWTIYLLGYEFMFRGLLLFSFYYAYGAITAIAINILLYSLIHIPKGKKETIGAIPLGLILSIITLNTGSFIVAFVFHVIMALSNDFFAIKAHPQMSFQKKQKL